MGSGKSLTIAGYELRGGLLYVGKELERQDGAGVENCLIDPSLAAKDTRGATLTFLFPWAGSVSTGTLALALKGAGLEVSTRGVILEADRTPADKVIEALRKFEGAPAPDAVYLAMTVGNLIQEKYDPYLPHELLAIGYASDRMRPEAVPVLARRLLTQTEDQI